MTLNWKYKWHLQKKWQIWGHSHLPDPAEFSVSYQILSADDPPIEIEIATRTHLGKYLSQNNEQGPACSMHSIGHLSFRSHLLPSWLNSFLWPLKQMSIHLIPQWHYYEINMYNIFLHKQSSSVKCNTIMGDRMNQFCLCLISTSHFSELRSKWVTDCNSECNKLKLLHHSPDFSLLQDDHVDHFAIT